MHELVHACVGVEHQHKAPFKRLARALHLEGKLTATHGGTDFKTMMQPLIDKIGPIPHKRLDFTNADGPKKQTTRLIKVVCPGCEYPVRITRTWLDESGAPICPTCRFQMEEE